MTPEFIDPETPNFMNAVDISDSQVEPHRDPPHQASILELSIFVALTFLISWPLWFMSSKMPGMGFRMFVFSKTIAFPLAPAFFTLGTISLGISAIILLLASSRRHVHIRSLWRSLTTLRGYWGWYAFALLIVPLIHAGSVIFYVKVGGKIIASISPSSWIYLFLVNLPFAPFWEEIGWRGFLLPRVISRSKDFIASIIVGAVSALWMSPFYGVLSISSTRQQWVHFLYFASTSIAMSVIFTCVYLGTRESLIPVIALHSSALASGTMLMHILPSGERLPYFVAWRTMWVVAILVYSLVRRSLRATRTD